MSLPVPTLEQVVAFQRLVREERGVRLTLAEAAESATELLQAVWVAGHVSLDMEEGWHGRPAKSYDRRAVEMFPDWDESSLRHFRRDRRPPES